MSHRTASYIRSAIRILAGVMLALANPVAAGGFLILAEVFVFGILEERDAE